MTREEFMDIVYLELHSDGDNNRANRIIDAADEFEEESIRATIDHVLEIIDGYKSKATEPTKLSASTYNILLDRMKIEVFALKGGDQE